MSKKLPLPEQFTYPDLAGKRHLRRYVIAALFIVIVVCGLYIWGEVQHDQAQAIVMATPRPLVDILPSLTPVPTTLPPTATPTLEPCPTDYKDWTFASFTHGGNYKRIDPACVYEGLGRTVAWNMLYMGMGYDDLEAAQMLGFDELPQQLTPEVMAMTNQKGPLAIEFAYSEDAPEYVPDFHVWLTNGDGQPGMTITLRGCFRTYDIAGNEIRSWNEDYPVICSVSIDQTEQVTVEYSNLVFTSHVFRTRSFYLYGYIGVGEWAMIGGQTEPVFQIKTDPDEPDYMDLSIPLDEILNDQQTLTTFLGVELWNTECISATYGITMLPLPHDWQTHTDPAEYQLIEDALEESDP